MSSTNIKQEARRLIDNLPKNATWDDLMYETYIRQAIESGLASIGRKNKRAALPLM